MNSEMHSQMTLVSRLLFRLLPIQILLAYAAGSGSVAVRFEPLSSPRGAMITFLDSGIPFNPLKAPEPDVTLSAEERTGSGLGIFLVRRLMDNMTYSHVDGRNILSITKMF